MEQNREGIEKILIGVEKHVKLQADLLIQYDKIIEEHKIKPSVKDGIKKERHFPTLDKSSLIKVEPDLRVGHFWIFLYLLGLISAQFFFI